MTLEGDVPNQLRARAIARVVVEGTLPLVCFEKRAIRRGREGRAMMIEVPVQPVGGRKAVVEDGVFIAIEQALQRRLTRRIAASQVAKLYGRPPQLGQQPGKNDRTTQAVETVPVGGDDRLHRSLLAHGHANPKKRC